MARQRGVIRVKGLLGDLSFYHSGGKDLVKTPGGASKKAILNEPQFKRTRENMSEFGGAAMVGKAFRGGMAEVLPVFKERYLTSRMLSIFRKVCSNGPGVRGERTFEIVNNTMLLAGFNFNPSKILGALFSAPFDYGANTDRNETNLKVSDFNTSNYINAPAGATHFRLVNIASILSDYEYNVTTKKYEPVNDSIEGLNAVTYSNYIPLGGMVGSVTVLTSTIGGAPVMVPSAGLMGCIGIEFFQIVNTDYYLLNAENAMRIQNVF